MNYLEIFRNMGFRYTAYRSWYEFKRRTGILRLLFPVSCDFSHSVDIEEWRRSAMPFFFSDRSAVPDLLLEDSERSELRLFAEKIFRGEIRFFNGEWLSLGNDYDWISNPVSGFRFHPDEHWSAIEEFKPKQGDIKYVWEKSRFCYLYTIIRYDHHFKKDNAEFVFKEICSWIAHNPYNCGPNFKCSQEIALRVLNWIFTLYFYSKSKQLELPPLFLTKMSGPSFQYSGLSVFQLIVNSIRQQTIHVEKNINFSRYTVRNNHTITEALCLYTVGTLFPWFPESGRWKKKGKKYLVKEGLYQLKTDGSYVQYSFNYHRVALQLFTWALALARKNNDEFPGDLKRRLQESIWFLFQAQDANSGNLPNFGANDGSLFFPLNSYAASDFRPQLNTLQVILTGYRLYKNTATAVSEDLLWFNGNNQGRDEADALVRQSVTAAPFGGYFIMRSSNRHAFVRCCKYLHRPIQADNLHLDIWYKGHNIVRDCGSFSYNVSAEDADFFQSTRAHNTVMVNSQDQMEKGPRFIWYKWSDVILAHIIDTENYLEFKGSIRAFKQIAHTITHTRIVRQYKNKIMWEITDEVAGWNGRITQIWNISPAFGSFNFCIEAFNKNGVLIEPSRISAWYSPTYGIKEKADQFHFNTDTGFFRTYLQM